MDRAAFIKALDGRLKLIRNEHDFTQDKMAEILGISKKTLVQIEKGRASLGWTGAVALCGIFNGSELLEMTLGGSSQELIQTLAFNIYERQYPKTLGGKVWWHDILNRQGCRIQQNIVSHHYRILDREDCRICSSFDFAYIQKKFRKLGQIDRRKLKNPRAD
jgi:DNA-binding XRE family transcriptional regulator